MNKIINTIALLITSIGSCTLNAAQGNITKGDALCYGASVGAVLGAADALRFEGDHNQFGQQQYHALDRARCTGGWMLSYSLLYCPVKSIAQNIWKQGLRGLLQLPQIDTNKTCIGLATLAATEALTEPYHPMGRRIMGGAAATLAAIPLCYSSARYYVATKWRRKKSKNKSTATADNHWMIICEENSSDKSEVVPAENNESELENDELMIS